MGISKIGTLFAANVDAIPASNPSSSVSARPEAQPAASPPANDAVVLSANLRNMGKTPLADADTARAARLQELKQQVKSGSYKPSSEKVAVAVIRDLA